MGNVRQIKKDDEAQVRELILSILEKEYPFDRSAYSDSDINNIMDVYGPEGNAFFVLEADGRVVGTVGVMEDSKERALLRRLFLLPGFRKKGFGRKLMEKALDFCRKKGYKNAAFRTTSKMVDAINLCKKMGFEERESLDISGFKIYEFIKQVD